MIWLVFIWVFLCVMAGFIASNKGRSGIGFFLLAFLLSPLVGFIAALCARDAATLAVSGHDVAGFRKCPYCAEAIRAEAIKCRHCGSEVTQGQSKETTVADMVARADARRSAPGSVAK